MKKGVKKYSYILIIILIIAVICLALSLDFKASGNAVNEHAIGPSAEEQACMKQCMGCTSPGAGCSGNQEKCMTQCNAKKPESTSETTCMEKCVNEGCDKFDFGCQTKNQEKCEKQCDMQRDKPDKSKMSPEQLCITNCVEAVDPDIRCQASQQGETGNEICQRCANQCQYLYAGPCLGDEKLKAKQKECETCEHCYGEPVMGDSGQGWECIVDVQCKDASSEFGDEPGTGEGIAKTVEGLTNGIGDVFEKIGDYFGNLFSKEE